ncbi:MAG: hypothetical protein Q3972_07265 [Corynebacterium sp.]|nr:hypothetical protein [Corynebacterium sp.]
MVQDENNNFGDSFEDDVFEGEVFEGEVVNNCQTPTCDNLKAEGNARFCESCAEAYEQRKEKFVKRMDTTATVAMNVALFAVPAARAVKAPMTAAKMVNPMLFLSLFEMSRGAKQALNKNGENKFGVKSDNSSSQANNPLHGIKMNAADVALTAFDSAKDRVKKAASAGADFVKNADFNPTSPSRFNLPNLDNFNFPGKKNQDD